MKLVTLAGQIDTGRLACDTQWNYVDGWEWQGNGDRSACQTIDCYPLAPLKQTLHLYDKQLNGNPSTCLLLSFRPLSLSAAAALSVIPLSLCLYCFSTLSISLCVTIWSNFVSTVVRWKGGGVNMENLPSNWLQVQLRDTWAVCFELICGMACGNEKWHVIFVCKLFTLQHKTSEDVPLSVMWPLSHPAQLKVTLNSMEPIRHKGCTRPL